MTGSPSSAFTSLVAAVRKFKPRAAIPHGVCLHAREQGPHDYGPVNAKGHPVAVPRGLPAWPRIQPYSAHEHLAIRSEWDNVLSLFDEFLAAMRSHPSLGGLANRVWLEILRSRECHINLNLNTMWAARSTARHHTAAEVASILQKAEHTEGLHARHVILRENGHRIGEAVAPATTIAAISQLYIIHPTETIRVWPHMADVCADTLACVDFESIVPNSKYPQWAVTARGYGSITGLVRAACPMEAATHYKAIYKAENQHRFIPASTSHSTTIALPLTLDGLHLDIWRETP